MLPTGAAGSGGGVAERDSALAALKIERAPDNERRDVLIPSSICYYISGANVSEFKREALEKGKKKKQQINYTSCRTASNQTQNKGMMTGIQLGSFR